MDGPKKWKLVLAIAGKRLCVLLNTVIRGAPLEARTLQLVASPLARFLSLQPTPLGSRDFSHLSPPPHMLRYICVPVVLCVSCVT